MTSKRSWLQQQQQPAGLWRVHAPATDAPAENVLTPALLAYACAACSCHQIDWDYHMQLAPRGTPFLDPSVGSIIHFLHFRSDGAALPDACLHKTPTEHTPLSLCLAVLLFHTPSCSRMPCACSCIVQALAADRRRARAAPEQLHGCQHHTADHSVRAHARVQRQVPAAGPDGLLHMRRGPGIRHLGAS